MKKNDEVNHPQHYTSGKIEALEIIEDVTNFFESLNVRWLITGQGPQEVYGPRDLNPSTAQEPESVYMTKSHEQKKLLQEKERIIDQQQATINALNEAYGQLKLRFQDLEEK